MRPYLRPGEVSDYQQGYEAGCAKQRKIDAELVRKHKVNDGRPFNDDIDYVLEQVANEIEDET